MIGVLLVNKPEGITSHDVVYRVRRALGTKRVGHAGTLDPIATGLLVLAVGPATRFLQYLPLEPKEYDCTVLFGQETNTYDAEGTVTATLPVPSDLGAKIQEARPGFLGKIEQLPPLYSAVKKAGKPLYAYARKGEEVERDSRSVFVESFDVLSVVGDRADLRLVCSGGTYVRTLAHDLGQVLGCGAHVVALQRTRVGEFDIDDTCETDEISPDKLIPLREALKPMPMVQLNEGQLGRIRNGQWVKVDAAPPVSHVALLDVNGDVVSVAKVQGNVLQPECVIPSEAQYEPV